MVTRLHRCASLCALHMRRTSTNWCSAALLLNAVRLSTVTSETEYIQPHLPTSTSMSLVLQITSPSNRQHLSADCLERKGKEKEKEY